jgi:hypothetical protein
MLLAICVAVSAGAASSAWAAAGAVASGSTASAGARRHDRTGTHDRTRERKARPCVVAVQPIAGNAGTTVRGTVTRIVRLHGYHTLTTLPAYEGTGQYPGLARENNVRAFVTADLEERGSRRALTFLVWSGSTGSVVGRWSVAAPGPGLLAAIDAGFWRNLGPALVRAKAPPSSELDEAPPVRIDAVSEDDAIPVARRN